MLICRYFSLFLIFFLIACSTSRESVTELEQKTADSLYKKGYIFLKNKNYEDAGPIFKEIETLFPYSSKSSESQILSAYCHFMTSNYTDLIRELDIFLRYHSSHVLVPYAMYLKAICLYIQTSSIERDQRIAQDARQAFVEIINRFPNSKYYEDVMKRIVILDDIIACHEINIGKFYQKRKNTSAAIGRYNFIVNYLSHTSHASEAYYRILECCKYEGLEDEAVSALEVLNKKFPKNKWTIQANLIMTKKQ